VNKDTQSLIREFVAERDWDQFHTPRNLILALTGEVGELAELVQWKSDDQVIGVLATPDGRAAFEQELADIAIYITRLAEVAGVDLNLAIQQKVELNRRRYPIEQVKGKAVKHTELEHD
jgi:dCTP diphosphatase